jgi:hypothetical protein
MQNLAKLGALVNDCGEKENHDDRREAGSAACMRKRHASKWRTDVWRVGSQVEAAQAWADLRGGPRPTSRFWK